MKLAHDVGGEPEGPVDPQDHAKTFTEQRIDAIRALTVHLCRTDELRRAREQLGADGDRMTYYERQITAMTQVFVEKGVLQVADLARKLAEIEARERGT